MVQPMRRRDRQLPKDQAIQLLQTCEHAVLATVNEDFTPYCIPISPVLEGEHLYFHCAPEGQKLDNIRQNTCVCLTCVGFTELLPAEFSTRYESAVAVGTAKMVEDAAEKVHALKLLCTKYAPGNMAAFEKAAAASLHRTAICKIKLESVTGKAKR